METFSPLDVFRCLVVTGATAEVRYRLAGTGASQTAWTGRAVRRTQAVSAARSVAP